MTTAASAARSGRFRVAKQSEPESEVIQLFSSVLENSHRANNAGLEAASGNFI